MLILVSEEDEPRLESIVEAPTGNPLELYKRFLDMEIVCEKHGGVGLSAIQVGLPWKMFVIKSALKGQYGYFLNCEYEPTTNAQLVVSLESCLSLRSKEGRLRHFQIERYSEIRVLGSRLVLMNNQLIIEKYENVVNMTQSILFQHEIDYQHGLRISNKGQEVLLWR